jgi:phospholipid/cholesterol/gamma-HCH transport system substrate-binding protein
VKVKSNDWIVGLVIVLTAIGIVVSTMFLQQTSLVNKRLGVVARFRDVGNLQVGNEAVIRGVHAGRVLEIKLADKGWVLVTLDLDKEITLPPDPVVLIQSSSMFGEWQAIITRREMVPANREVTAQLADETDAPPGALDGAVLPDIAQLTTVAGGIAGNVSSVAERVRVAFNDSAARELRTSIRNFAVLSGDLSRTIKAQSRNLDSIATDVRAGAEDLAATTAALRRTMSRADSATSQEQVQRIVSETERAMKNIREASERVNALTLALQGTEANARGVVVKADGILGKLDRGEGTLGMLLNDRSLYQNSDSLLIDLRSLLADFRKSPKKYINLSVF